MGKEKVQSKTELIVIPYKHAVGTPESLHLAVHSIRRYASFNLGVKPEIWIVGDKPNGNIDGVCHHAFASQPTLSPHVNMIRAIVSFINTRKDNHFILWHDDTIATANYSLQDFLPASMHSWPSEKVVSNYFIMDLLKTKELLESKGISPVNYCCHAPHVYETRPFLQMVRDYNLQMVSYDFETLYYNLQHIEPMVMSNWQDNGYSTIIMPNDRMDNVSAKFKGHRFISFGGSVTGQTSYDHVASLIGYGRNRNKENRCCVVVPIYKEMPTANELSSIEHSIDVFAGRCIYYVGPEGFNVSAYPAAVLHTFDSQYFRDLKSYSKLCCSKEFYQRFLSIGFDWMLICQPDCWAFEDRLDEYMSLGYDYIGAPWPAMPGIPCDGVGNGGFCLRNLDVFFRLTSMLNEYGHPEDRYWCIEKEHLLSIAPINVAADFSLEHRPTYFHQNFGTRRPMGCHKPWKFEYETFWKKHGVPPYED